MIVPLHLFPSIGWFQRVSQTDSIMVDGFENWVKQSHRNRFDIVGPNGRQSLSIPTVKASRHRFIDVEISYSEDWITKHLRSVETAYNRSPFFEFYAHEFKDLLNKRHNLLFDLNLAAVKWCFAKLNVDMSVSTTTSFDSEDVDEKFHLLEYPISYYQVFQDKNDFLENVSILDLLFNVGPEALATLLHKPPLSQI